MNLLFVYEVSYLKKVVYDMHMLAEAMSLRGHNIYAIDYESMWDGDAQSRRVLRVSRVFKDATVKLIRPSFIRVPVLSRLSAFATHYFAIEHVLRKKHIDAIILYSVPTNGLQIVYLAKKHKVPVIFRSLDVLNQLVAHPVLRPATRFLEKRVYSRVDWGLTISPKLSEYMMELGAKRTLVLPMPVDLETFRPFKSAIGERWGLSEYDQVILFMGTLFGFSGLDQLIGKFGRIVSKAKNAKLLVVGDGPQRRALEFLAFAYGLYNKVVITGFQPYQDMPHYINLADLCVLPFQTNNVTKNIFPGKTVQFLACGKPLVSTRLPGVQAVLGDDGGVVYADDMDEMTHTILSLLQAPTRMRQLGRNGLAYVKRRHDVHCVARQLEEVINGV